MAIQRRTSILYDKLPQPGPYLAVVTNNLDPTYMGCLEVTLIKGVVNDNKDEGQTFIVNYLSPFYGVTSVGFEGNDPRSFDDVQKSYGMWMIPPDIGATVMVIFVGGDPNQGYWFGCVQDRFQNHMVPGIAASQNVHLTPDQERKYGTKYLPVAELHKKSSENKTNFNNVPKPIHPFADRLLSQGLLLDEVRGVTSSSARREIPSNVFGISTPGPLDPNGRKGKIGYDSKVTVPVSRLGGSTFVMDDGDVDGQNELVRIRTRTGHQILLHNSQDLVYIANSKGSAWVELTSNGKIDIYAEDSVSIHTKNDFNFRADRDINMEAGRNININAIGSADINIGDHMYLIVTGQGKINFAKNLDKSVNGTSKTMIGEDQHLNVGKSIFHTASDNNNIAAGAELRISANGDLSVSSNGTYKETATVIHMNGPAATPADAAVNAEIPSPLPTYNVPATDISAGWSSGNFYKSGTLETIMQRVPMHEPWNQHENVNPAAFTPASTDASAIARPDVISVSTATLANQSSAIPGACSISAAQAIGAPNAQFGISAIKAACVSAGLTSPYAVASLLAIVGGESAWIPQSEGYSYSAEALPVVFAKTFRGKDDLIAKYARWTGPREEFFNFVYAPENNGSSLGNTKAGDGGKYFGRGFIQLTGRANYTKYGNFAGVDIINNPEILNLDLVASAKVAAAFLKDKVKLDQTDPMYFDAALSAVGGERSSWTKKRDYYNCFLAQLQANA